MCSFQTADFQRLLLMQLNHLICFRYEILLALFPRLWLWVNGISLILWYVLCIADSFMINKFHTKLMIIVNYFLFKFSFYHLHSETIYLSFLSCSRYTKRHWVYRWAEINFAPTQTATWATLAVNLKQGRNQRWDARKRRRRNEGNMLRDKSGTNIQTLKCKLKTPIFLFWIWYLKVNWDRSHGTGVLSYHKSSESMRIARIES